MDKKDLIAHSPVRYFDVTNAGLKDGEMGLITAKKGLGKTSILVQFGIDSLLNDKALVHVSFDQQSSNVKIVKVLRSVYRAYYDLKSKFERLQADYGREVSKNSTLSERIYEVCAERDSLKGKVRDYERVRRAIGPEQADRILEAAYQQEQAEKERKRAARQKARLGAR